MSEADDRAESDLHSIVFFAFLAVALGLLWFATFSAPMLVAEGLVLVCLGYYSFDYRRVRRHRCVSHDSPSNGSDMP